MRKKVLVVCMMNSVHSAKWLALFKDAEIDFYIFPSTYFRSVHPILNRLIISTNKATYNIESNLGLPGYWDYAQEKIIRLVLPRFSRKRRLDRFINSVSPEIIHALEFQHSAYLCADVIDPFGKKFDLIVTNWGSDIYHFMNLSQHDMKIRRVLALADKYSAECARDLSLATKLGFKGKFLPIIPNAGGFASEEILQQRSKTSSRKQIVVKGYGGYFGRVQLVIEALYSILDDFPEITVFFFSATQDVYFQINTLRERYADRVNYSTYKKPLSQRDIQRKFSDSRVYIGCSISDGISTSFLDSIISGTYPIQTSTSCANEWIKKGAIASLVDLNVEEIGSAIRSALVNDDLVNYAQAKNFEVSKRFLQQNIILEQALTFYSQE
jgi:hypothetical protein